jgi:hypothetical protein
MSTCGKYGYYIGLLCDWQTLAAGIIAAVAAAATIWFTVRKANHQIAAAQMQTATMRLMERERANQEAHAFYAVLEAAMQTVIEDAIAAEKISANEPKSGSSVLAYQARQRIKKTAFPELRNAFLRHGDLLVGTFLRLEEKIDLCAAQWDYDPNRVGDTKTGACAGLASELSSIKQEAIKLRTAAGLVKKRTAVDLAETQEKKR